MTNDEALEKAKEDAGVIWNSPKDNPTKEELAFERGWYAGIRYYRGIDIEEEMNSILNSKCNICKGEGKTSSVYGYFKCINCRGTGAMI